MEEKFRTRWNVHHVLGTLDGKHIAMKKPKNSGSDYFYNSDYYNYGFCSLVNAEYRFLLVNVGYSGSSSDVHIFNRNDLRENIEDSTLGLLPLNHWREGPNLHYFFLGDDTFTLMSWMLKPYSRRPLTRKERIANCRISRGRIVVRNAFGILLSRFRVLLGTMEQR